MPHRSREFEAVYAECQAGLQEVFCTRSAVLTLAGSGSLAVESALWSLARPGDSTLTCVNGKFSERWRDSAARFRGAYGGEARTISAPWGEAIAQERLERALREALRTDLIVIVHCETSTGALSDARALCEAAHRLAPEAIVLLDAITTVAAVPLEMDAWGIDAVACASQKALGLPPGLGFIALGDRAANRFRTGSAAAIPLYLDLSHYLSAHERGTTPFTPATSLHVALRESLRLIDRSGGVEACRRRTAHLAGASRTAFKAMGLRLAATTPSDSLTSVRIPDRLAEELRDWCRAKNGVIFAGGQNQWKGEIIRMSHMGFVTRDDTLAGIEGVAAGLEALRPGVFDIEAGLRAARAALSDETLA